VANERTVKKLDFGAVRALRPTPHGIGSAFGPAAKCHSADGGSVGTAFGCVVTRRLRAMGIRDNRHRPSPGAPIVLWDDPLPLVYTVAIADRALRDGQQRSRGSCQTGLS
jgi:hypothetical protein